VAVFHHNITIWL